MIVLIYQAKEKKNLVEGWWGIRNGRGALAKDCNYWPWNYFICLCVHSISFPPMFPLNLHSHLYFVPLALELVVPATWGDMVMVFGWGMLELLILILISTLLDEVPMGHVCTEDSDCCWLLLLNLYPYIQLWDQESPPCHTMWTAALAEGRTSQRHHLSLRCTARLAGPGFL